MTARLSPEAAAALAHMQQSAPARGGFMYEGARPAYERGEYFDAQISELLAKGLIKPHADPDKGWVVT